MAFNAAAVTALFSAVVSTAQELGIFARVNQHEPKSAPGAQLSCSFWGATIKPVQSSGLASTSGVVTFNARIYQSFVSKPEDGIDPAIMTAACVMMAAYSDEFTLDGTVREVDLLGQFGESLAGQLGYMEQDGKFFRVCELVIPIVINDMFTQEA